MKRAVLNFLISSLLVVGFFSSANVAGATSVGVNSGDWAEYAATYVGSPSEQFLNWTKICVKNVEGSNVTVHLTSTFLNGEHSANQGCFGLQDGVPGVFIIPANLEVTNQFYPKEYGNITIEGTKELVFDEIKRTAVYSTVNQTTLHWDKATGVLLQLEVTWQDFTQNLLLQKTNLWETQQSGPETIIICSLLLAAVVLVLCCIMRKRLKQESSKTSNM